MLERIIVGKYIYPSLLTPPPALHFNDQFAFRPSGSTTAALISLLHRVTNLLNTNAYVFVYALDFSKAFDTVRHSTLMDKLALLDIPSNIHNWVINFFQDHKHCTKFNGNISGLESINASVIQGSAIGPASYLVNASDLSTINKNNAMFKFADDTYLVIAADHIDTRDAELSNVNKWASANNLNLNTGKSLEIVFCPKSQKIKNAASIPPPISGIARVNEIEILGVTISSVFSVSPHIDAILASCHQVLFALRTLRFHGLNDNSLQTIFMSVALSKLRYASPAWFGFASANDKSRIEAFLRKCKRCGYYDAESPSFDIICNKADEKLFIDIIANPNHVLHQLLPAKAPRNYDLRPRRHNYTLPRRSSAINDCNFLFRMLYKSK